MEFQRTWTVLGSAAGGTVTPLDLRLPQEPGVDYEVRAWCNGGIQAGFAWIAAGQVRLDEAQALIGDQGLSDIFMAIPFAGMSGWVPLPRDLGFLTVLYDGAASLKAAVTVTVRRVAR